MRVLITNITLASRSGTEINVRDIALGLLRRGHRPVVYSPELGDIAREIRAATVPVVDDLAAIATPPELIHGHHHPVTLAALLRFPGVPALYHVHDWTSWFDEPLRFPRVVLYAPVDETNADRLSLEHAVPRERIRVLLNAVDLARFGPRAPLPRRPQRALVFSNAAKPGTYVDAVSAACAAAGISLEVLGSGAGRVAAAPESLLGAFDLVFAKGRSALEALAVGTAVILCDREGLGGLVTRAAVERMRPLNFGRRLLQRPPTAESLRAEIARYDPADAAAVSQWVRGEADLEAAMDRLLAVYAEVVELARADAAVNRWHEESRAASAYLTRWAPRFGDEVRRASAEHAAAAAEYRLGVRTEELAERTRQAAALEQELALRTAELRELARQSGMSAASLDRVEDLEAQLDWMSGTATWRLRERALRLPGLVPSYRRLRGLGSSPRGQSLPAAAAVPTTPEPLPSLQARAERMAIAGGFLGVPLDRFEEEGRLQLATLLRLGLQPWSKVLDIGCGVLRAGYWLIRLLEPGGYCGIEPHRRRVELALAHLLEPGVAAAKQPRFDDNAVFDSAVFGERFDYFLARSIWSHASKPQIRRMLDGFVRDGREGCVFLTSFLPASAGRPDHEGEDWVGTSHESSVPGVVGHRLGWIEQECAARGLHVAPRPEDDFGGQQWLVIRARS